MKSRYLFLFLLLALSPFFDWPQASAQTIYYGVNVNESTGEVSGYAWNDGIGWIDFNAVTFNAVTRQLSGNAVLVDLLNRGLDGNLSMLGDCVPSCGGYAVSLNLDGTVTGSAWNDAIGWVQFNHAFGSVIHNASQVPSLSGFAWNDNIGWIQMSELTPTPEEGGCSASPFNTCRWAWSDNIGWISHNSVDNPSVPEFGVHVNDETGEVSGHAWNDHLGYIDFSSASYDSVTGELSGTADILSLGANSILNLRGDCTPSCGGFGVSIDSNGALSGHAWNDVTGWIDFSPGLGGVFFNQDQIPSLSGWAWNDHYGWIAFRFTNYDIEYGVHVEEDGNITGYAWSQIGWLDYDPAGPYPTSPQHSARWNQATGEVSGWARFVSINAAGQDGWVKLRDTGAVSYGVQYNQSTNRWNGWAWSDTIGWIQYNHIFGSVITQLRIESGPLAPTLIEPLACVDTYTLYPVAALTPVLDWSDYSALDESTQKGYHIQVDDDPLFGSPLIDEVMEAPDSLYTVGLGELVYNATYYWRVRVQSAADDSWSEWGEQGPVDESNCFRTPLHPAPQCAFTLDPAQPTLGQPTQFTDQTITYGGATIVEWDWDFGDGTTLTGSDQNIHQNPEHEYATEQDLQISLSATDSDGYSCTTTTDASVGILLPEFRRVIPR